MHKNYFSKKSKKIPEKNDMQPKSLNPDAKKSSFLEYFLEHFLLKFYGCSFVPTSLPLNLTYEGKMARF